MSDSEHKDPLEHDVKVEVVFDSGEKPSEGSASDASTSTGKTKPTRKKKHTTNLEAPKPDQPPKSPTQPPPASPKPTPPPPPPKPQRTIMATQLTGTLQPINAATDDFDVWLVTFKSFLKINGLEWKEADKCHTCYQPSSSSSGILPKTAVTTDERCGLEGAE